MKRKTVYVGVVLIIVGLILVVFGNMSREVLKLVSREDSSVDTWSFSAYYEKGQKLGFGISTGENWWIYLDIDDEFKVGGDYIDYLPVVVIITAPAVAPGKNVTLEVEYSPIPGSTAPIPPLDVFIVKVLHKSDILKMETSVEEWKPGNRSEYLNENKIQNGIGIVQYSGWYHLTVDSVSYISPDDPNSRPSSPQRIILYKYNIEVFWDYWYLIPTGGSIAVVGVVVVVFGARSVQKRARVEMLKKTSKS